jgi:glycosyltransferase involved in cell wall biosynthesis
VALAHPVRGSAEGEAAPGPTPGDPPRVAFLLDDLEGGGVQRMTLVLAGEFARAGHAVDVLVCSRDGDLAPLVPRAVDLLELESAGRRAAARDALRGDLRLGAAFAREAALGGRRLRYARQLPALVRYLRARRPAALISATPRINLLAVAGVGASGVATRSIVTERISIAAKLGAAGEGRWRKLLPLLRRGYRLADHVVAVSHDLADEAAEQLDVPRERVLAIHNPVVGPELAEELAEPLDDPWFAPGAPPVILSAGRISAQKDFETLVRAFALLRRTRPCRLVILGKNHDGRSREERRHRLLALAAELGVADDVRLPGFVLNPFPHMARAALFVLSSRYEGLPGVLIQALACGTPVVSTACPTGPREILEDGRYGHLVPVGDVEAIAKAMVDTLDRPPPRDWLAARARHFSVERAFAAYRSLVLAPPP